MMMCIYSAAAGAGTSLQWISERHGQLSAGTRTIDAIQCQLSARLSDVAEQQFGSGQSVLHVWWV